MGKGKKKSKSNSNEKSEQTRQSETVVQSEVAASDVREKVEDKVDIKEENSQSEVEKNYSLVSNRSERNSTRYSNTPYRQNDQYKRNQQDEADGIQKKKFNSNYENKSYRQGPGDNSNERSFERKKQEGKEDFNEYSSEFRSLRGLVDEVKTREITQDLFEMSEEYSLAHCVAEDMNMGSGIAVQFRYKFKQVNQLLNQYQSTGGLAVLEDKGRYIYYLVTKKLSSGKPTYMTLFSSLKRLKEHVLSHGVTKIAMPKIGCGLDRLDWPNVKFMLEFIFRDVDIEIIICNLEPTEDSSPQRHKNCKVTHETYPIETIAEGTLIIYFSSEDEFISEDMKKLDEKFHFLNEFRHARKRKGDVIFYTRNESYLLCGCIVRKNRNDLFDFVTFSSCLSTIQKENKKRNFFYYAFQAFNDKNDSCINYKIINLLRNNLREVEVYVCWPADLINEMTSTVRFTDDRDSARLGNKSEEQWSSKNYKFTRNRSPQAKTFCKSNSDYDSNWRGGNRNFAYETKKTDQAEGKPEQPAIDWFESDAEICRELRQRSFRKSELKETSDNNSKFSTNLQIVENENFPNYCSRSRLYYNSYEVSRASEPEPSSSTQEQLPLEKTTANVYKKVEITEDVESDGETNVEFEEWQQGYTSIDCKSIKEQNSSNLPNYYSRVCFASEDMMIRGTIPDGQPTIGSVVGTLLQQHTREGGLAWIKISENFLYCLIISSPTSLPTSKSLFRTIKNLKRHINQNNIKTLVIPKIDSLEGNLTWLHIKSMFQFLIGNLKIDIRAVSCNMISNLKSITKENGNSIKHVKSGLHQQHIKSIILLLGSSDGEFPEEMKSLKRNFNHLESWYSNQQKSLGDVITYNGHEDYVVYGCIVKQLISEPIQFEKFQKCVVEVNRRNQSKEKFKKVVMQAICDPDGLNYKLITVLLHCLKDVEISICWPGAALKNLMPKS